DAAGSTAPGPNGEFASCCARTAQVKTPELAANEEPGHGAGVAIQVICHPVERHDLAGELGTFRSRAVAPVFGFPALHFTEPPWDPILTDPPPSPSACPAVLAQSRPR